MDKTMDDYERNENRLRLKIRTLKTEVFELECAIDKMKKDKDLKIKLFDDFMMSLIDFDKLKSENEKLKGMLKDFSMGEPRNFFTKSQFE